MRNAGDEAPSPDPDITSNQNSSINTELIARWSNLELSKSLKSQKGGIRSIAITRWKGQHNKPLLFASNDSGAIEVWALESGRFIYDITRSEELHSDTPTIAIVPQPQILISTTENHRVKACYIAEGKEYIYGQHDEWILSLVLSPDGSYLATGDRQGIIKIWDIQKHMVIYNLLQMHQQIWSLAFDPRSQILASGGAEDSLCLWDLATGNLICQPNSQQNSIYALTFSADGETLVTAGADGIIDLWTLPRSN